MLAINVIAFLVMLGLLGPSSCQGDRLKGSAPLGFVTSYPDSLDSTGTRGVT
jgi:hypothetical protein